MSIDEKILLDLVEKRYGEGYGENEKTGGKNEKNELREETNITPFDGNNVTMGGGGRLNRQNTSTSKLMKLLNKK